MKFEADPQVMGAINNSIPLPDLSKINLKDHMAFGITDREEIILMFTLEQGKEKHFVPEPDLVVCLFECGRQNAVQLPNLRKNLLSELGDNSKTINNSYTFYATACVAVTLQLNALEAFINRQIPNDFEYISEDTRQTVIQNKKQIERNTSFEKKIKDIIPNATGKSFHITHPDKYTTLSLLKELRDDMTHLKSYHAKNAPLTYETLYNKAFKFDYLQALNAVKFYINFYSDNLIEPCSCGADF